METKTDTKIPSLVEEQKDGSSKEQSQRAADNYIKDLLERLDIKEGNVSELEKRLTDLQEALDHSEDEKKDSESKLIEANSKLEELQTSFEESREIIAKSKLDLDINHEENLTTLESFVKSNAQVPELQRVKIFGIRNENLDTLNGFLLSCINKPIENLCFNFGHVMCFNGSKIIPGLIKCLPLISREAYFCQTEFQPKDLEKVMKSATETERMIFRSCKLHTKDGMDFSSVPTSLKYLCFDFSYCEFSMNWDERPDRFERIIKAIKKSPIKNSLQTISLWEAKISNETVQEQLRKHGLPNITVVNEPNEPL